MSERGTPAGGSPETPEQCASCEGSGIVPIGEHFVTHDMALDACELSMQGMSIGIEYAQCPDCEGTGVGASSEKWTTAAAAGGARTEPSPP